MCSCCSTVSTCSSLPDFETVISACRAPMFIPLKTRCHDVGVLCRNTILQYCTVQSYFCTRLVNTWLLRRTGEHYSSTPAAYFPALTSLARKGRMAKIKHYAAGRSCFFTEWKERWVCRGDNSVDPLTTPRRYRLYKFEFCKNQNRLESSTIVAGLS